MFLALIVLVLAAMVAGTLVARAAKAVLSIFRGSDSKEETAKEARKGEDKEPVKSEKVSAQESQQETAETGVQQDNGFSEEQTERLDHAQRLGISEVFWKEPSECRIDGKAIADTCVESSSLTYLEVNNRELAGNDFMGFNLIVEQDSRVVLTYDGQAVATLTRVEKTVKKDKDGSIEEVKTVHYRTNTFPPKLARGMVPDDVEKMLCAASSIRATNGDPELVLSEMISCFSSTENASKFRLDVAPKIQAKESKKRSQEKKTTRSMTMTRV